jgi:hypothetical protein
MNGTLHSFFSKSSIPVRQMWYSYSSKCHFRTCFLQKTVWFMQKAVWFMHKTERFMHKTDAIVSLWEL